MWFEKYFLCLLDWIQMTTFKMFLCGKIFVLLKKIIVEFHSFPFLFQIKIFNLFPQFSLIVLGSLMHFPPPFPSAAFLNAKCREWEKHVPSSGAKTKAFAWQIQVGPSCSCFEKSRSHGKNIKVRKVDRATTIYSLRGVNWFAHALNADDFNYFIRFRA